MANPTRDVANMRQLVMEVQQDGQYSRIEDFISDKWVNHTALPGTTPDKAGVYAAMKFLHSVLSDIKMEIIHCTSDGKVVATNKVMHGRFTGEFHGRQGKGEKAHLKIMDFITVDEKTGFFVEHWHMSDFQIEE